ncbi:MAG: NnrS family protein [Rhodospirillales bacterium]|nr:NnrS family protein [Rhodospirillales bacterium]
MRAFLQVFLSHGFRPFFLFAGAYGAVAAAAWLAILHRLHGGAALAFPQGALPPHLWHGHEMLFGYASAVVAGFFLTAVPNWTGREPLRGLPLGALALAWLAGRVAMWSAAVLPPALVAALDLAFVPFLAVLVVRALSGGWSRRNAIFLPVFAALFAGNVLFHLDAAGVVPGLGSRGLLLALDTILFLIAVIGGRVVPAFTTNALRRAGEDRFPLSRPPVEAAALLSVAALAIADLLAPDSVAAGAVAAAAAAVHAARLAGWRGHRTLGEPILWIIHLGYAWLVLGFALKALALLGGFLPATAANHALTIGAIGSMTLGVMSRAALGHTGREISAPAPIVAAYLLVSASALARVAGPALLPGYASETLAAAAILWIAAFALFTAHYFPILTRPRRRAEA